MSAQEKILKKFGASGFEKNDKGKSHKPHVTPERIRKLLRQFYDPQPTTNIHFYIQNADGCPTAKVETQIAGESIPCTVAFTNELNASDWRSVEKPENFTGPKWPPRTVSDLLGCSTIKETCVECAFSEITIALGEVYLAWASQMYNFWLDNIRLCRIPAVKGYGLKARETIPANKVIGEFTGKLLPVDEDLPFEQTQYTFEIDIGKSAVGDDPQPQCWLDATRRGSIFRFMNHSCNPNVKIDHGRCGIHNRILYVYTVREIPKGAQITTNYGEEWFSKEGDPCYCGSSRCINPPKKKTSQKEPKDSKDTAEGKKVTAANEKATKMKKVNEASKVPSTRQTPSKMAPPSPPRQKTSKGVSVPPAKVTKRQRPIIPEDSDDEKAPSKKIKPSSKRIERPIVPKDSDDEDLRPKKKLPNTKRIAKGNEPTKKKKP
jgi:hypothetical protein